MSQICNGNQRRLYAQSRATRHDAQSIGSDEPVRKADDFLVVVVVVVVLHRRHGRLVVGACRRIAVRVSAEHTNTQQVAMMTSLTTRASFKMTYHVHACVQCTVYV